METGLLWFDDDPNRDLAHKVLRAAAHYERKHGQRPNVCYVHPDSVSQEPVWAGGIRVTCRPSVLRHHFWIGIEEEREAPSQGAANTPAVTNTSGLVQGCR